MLILRKALFYTAANKQLSDKRRRASVSLILSLPAAHSRLSRRLVIPDAIYTYMYILTYVSIKRALQSIIRLRAIYSLSLSLFPLIHRVLRRRVCHRLRRRQLQWWAPTLMPFTSRAYTSSSSSSNFARVYKPPFCVIGRIITAR